MDPLHVLVYVGYAALAIMSIVLHEIAHGWVAYQCGDDTAYLMGRLTLNPLKHIDPFRTILLPILCVLTGFPAFGGAKPVPVNPYRLRHPVRDGRLVSVAGVAVNLLLAILFSLLLRFALLTGIFTSSSANAAILSLAAMTNLLLFVFNLMPIPPLDGSRLLRSFLPWEVSRYFDAMDRYGLLIVFLAIQFRGFHVLLIRAILFLWEGLLLLHPELLVRALNLLG